MKKNNIVKWLFGIIAVLAVVLALNSIVITYENEYKLVRVFGKVDRVITEEGITFKIPFVENVDTIPKQILLYDLETSDVITMDKKTMVTDTYVLWQVSDPYVFAKSLSASVTSAETRINAAVYNSLKEVIGGMTQAEVISARDGELSVSVMDRIGGDMDQYGIELVSVETKHLDLPDANKAAVYDRMISEREQMAAQYTAEGSAESQIIMNKTDKDVSIMLAEASAQAEQIVAEGEAQYMQILSSAYNDASRSDFYTFVRALDAAKASLAGGNKTLILSPDSPLVQIFYGQ
ncbi:MAG: protease modulator HflC [Lachnospiraceae bacterium]|nr:protease modulator HflC [Lachnospiraceae bacterium]MEE0685220.1 protease modulator HflC [Lachnospiraceae bacterium]MEE0863302.1 protease modulator HflC [Lachnospiraceae bacterium]